MEKFPVVEEVALVKVLQVMPKAKARANKDPMVMVKFSRSPDALVDAAHSNL